MNNFLENLHEQTNKEAAENLAFLLKSFAAADLKGSEEARAAASAQTAIKTTAASIAKIQPEKIANFTLINLANKAAFYGGEVIFYFTPQGIKIEKDGEELEEIKTGRDIINLFDPTAIAYEMAKAGVKNALIAQDPNEAEAEKTTELIFLAFDKLALYVFECMTESGSFTLKIDSDNGTASRDLQSPTEKAYKKIFALFA